LRLATEETGLKIEYVRVSGGAAVASCEGAGAFIRLPEQVGGLPVREICAYAFSAPGAAAGHLPAGTEFLSTRTGTAAAFGSEERFLGGAGLKEAMLPPGIRSVGEYAFYNCTGLSRLGLGGGAARIGNGAFMNCARLKKLLISAAPDSETCLPGLLAEIQHEVCVAFQSDGKKSEWIFPEYFEESIENCPARIFEHFIRGAGYRYRQVFQGDRLDADYYDRQFSAARSEAEPETLLRIALARLLNPFRLSEGSEKRYLSHLKENGIAAAELLIADDDPDGLAFLSAREVITRENVGAVVEAAAHAGRAECLSVLLNERRGRFAPREKTFDL
jgi:hypothetical protein